MTPAWCIIHVCFTCPAACQPLLEDLLCLTDWIQINFSHTVNNNHACCTLLDLELTLRLAFWDQQVLQLVKVEFNHVALELNIKVRHRFQYFKHFYYCTWCQPRHIRRSLYRKGFAWASLSIRKYAHVVAINSTLDQTSGILEDLLLSRIHPKDTVKLIVLHSILLSAHCQAHLVSLLVARDRFLGVCLLSLTKRPYTAVHSNFALDIFKLVQ